MFQVRIHGRGGQGVVTAAEMLSIAAFEEGKHAQSFPTFGSERTGAPVVSFCRIDDSPIRVREPVSEHDAQIVQGSLPVFVEALRRGGRESQRLRNRPRLLQGLRPLRGRVPLRGDRDGPSQRRSEEGPYGSSG